MIPSQVFGTLDFVIGALIVIVAAAFLYRLRGRIARWPPSILVAIGAAANSLGFIIIHLGIVRHAGIDGGFAGSDGPIRLALLLVAISAWSYLAHRLFSGRLTNADDDEIVRRAKGGLGGG